MIARRRLTWAGGVVMTLTVATGLAAAAAQKQSDPAQGPANAGATRGFSIQSEMLTYSAMDAEGGLVACAVAHNLGAADTKCAPRGTLGNNPGVVIVSGDSSAVAEFQLWRADISTMDILTRRASRYCPQQNQRGALSSAKSLVSGLPISQALSVAKALLTTTTVATPVGGDILDQTLMNDVAGHLRALGVQVVIPDTYMPHSLVTINEARSPFLGKFLALMSARGCVDVKPEGEAIRLAIPPAGAEHAAPEAERKAEITADRDKESIARAIDAFLETLTKPEVAAPVVAQPKETPAGAPAPQVPTISHLNAVMRADGLAQEMGFEPSSDTGDNSPWVVLWLKALESGGNEVSTQNLLRGSKSNYSGGSVGTYALFHLNGELECSGVFYNFAGPVQLADIPKIVDGSQPVSAGRLAGGCNPNPK